MNGSVNIDSDANSDYRRRLYDAYVRSGQAQTITGPSDLAPREAYLRQIITRHFPRDRASSILDIGCGPGALLYFAKSYGYSALRGIDASPEQVECAKALGLTCVTVGNVMQTLAAEPNGSLNLIVAFDVLEHLQKSEVLYFLDAAHHALAEGGQIIVHVPNAEGPFGGAIRYGDFTHELAFTRRSLAQVSAACGYSHAKCHEERPVPHGLKSTARWALWPVVRLLLRAMVAVETGDMGGEAIFTRQLLAVLHK